MIVVRVGESSDSDSNGYMGVVVVIAVGIRE